MKKLVWFELKKLLRPVTIAAALLLMSVNIYALAVPESIYPYDSKDMYEAYYSIASLVSGKLTEERVSAFNGMRDKLRNMTQEQAQAAGITLYTGSVAGDVAIYDEVFDDLRRVYNCNDSIGLIRQYNSDQRDLQTAAGGTYEVKICDMIDRTYSQRFVSSYHLTDGFASYFDYGFSSFLTLALIIIICSPVFSGEKESQMTSLISGTVNGRRELAGAKILASSIAAAAVSLIFSASDLLIFTLRLHLSGFSDPLYSIGDFEYTPLTMSTGAFIALNIIAKAAGFVLIALFVLLLSSVWDRSFTAMISAVVLCAGLMYICGFSVGRSLSLFDPISLITLPRYTGSFEVTGLFGTPVFTCILIPVCCAISAAITVIGILSLNNRNAHGTVIR